MINNLVYLIRDRFLEDENNFIFNLDFSGIGQENDFISDEDDNDYIISYPYTPLYNDTSIINLNIFSKKVS